MILLFDLAGVLLDFRGIESTRSMSRGGVDEAGFSKFWSHSDLADRWYRGRCTPAEFAAGVVAELSLCVSAEHFLSEFRRWLIGPYPGAFELLARLRRQHTIACLSNTNELDCGRFRDELRLHQRFDHCFFSNEIGLRKPDGDCYRFVLRALEARATDVIFFDDNRECVDGAMEAGLRAHQCIGLAAVVAQLTALHLYESDPSTIR